MKSRFLQRVLPLLFSLLISLPVGASREQLQPGGTLAIDCINGNLLAKRGITATGSQAVSARTTLSLDSTGTILTVSFQNTATLPGAVLYALDLGLPNKFVVANRMDAVFSDFPNGARWQGPTDLSGPTNAMGTSTFAARETIARRMDEFLNRQTSLSAGFLSAGQSGTITVKFLLKVEARNKPLLIDPVAYFLVNDPNAADKRMQIAATGVVKVN